MKKPVEFFDTDFLGNKIEIGDKVIFETPKYRDFTIGTVVTKAPKSCQIEYINTWNYSSGEKEIVRQYYGQIIKYPITKEGKWLFYNYNGIEYYKCSCCETEYPLPRMWGTADVKKYLKYCTNCGAKIHKEAL
jgi:hypothetical protein